MTAPPRPKVVLLGDSIRLGYETAVRLALEPDCEVWAPSQNGQHSANQVAHIQPWILDPQPALVHLNTGLHDVKVFQPGGECQIPLCAYRENLLRLIDAVRTAARAELILATTTPINEQAHNAGKEFDRFNAHIMTLNAVVRDLAQSGGIALNDLHAFAREQLLDELLPDGVHFTPEGYRRLGERVATVIRERLDFLANRTPTPDYDVPSLVE